MPAPSLGDPEGDEGGDLVADELEVDLGRGAGIGGGSLTLHPSGFVHGPQPGAVEAALGRRTTDETAVMIDTFSPLGLTGIARRLADPSYLSSWRGAATPAT